MNAAKIKLDLFRRIDNLPKSDIELIYNNLQAFINATSNYKLSKPEKNAIEEALEQSGNFCYTEDVMKEAKIKYPNLKFL
jgi:hypothetical protein